MKTREYYLATNAGMLHPGEKFMLVDETYVCKSVGLEEVVARSVAASSFSTVSFPTSLLVILIKEDYKPRKALDEESVTKLIAEGINLVKEIFPSRPIHPIFSTAPSRSFANGDLKFFEEMYKNQMNNEKG